MKHSFFPGDKWLYFKIYCGQSYANTLLIKHIYELAQNLTTDKEIIKWFFIRYEDLDFHIRFRVEISSRNHINSIIKKINKKLEKDIYEGKIWKLQLEPYQREIKRYGQNNIEIMEKLFWQDSIFVCEVLKILEGKENSAILLSMINMDITFSELGMIFKQKKEWATYFHRSLKNEFSINLVQKKGLNKYYRSSILNNFKEFTRNSKVITLIDEKISGYKVNLPLLTGDEKIFRNIYFGLNHMTCNRLFSNRQRLYEMICYDFLVKNYNLLTYKSKQK